MQPAIRTVLWAALIAAAGPAGAAETLLRFAAIVDGTGEVLNAREVVVADEAIAAVGNDLVDRFPGAVIVELQELTALPGLIDVHVHMTYGLEEPSHGDAWSELLASEPTERLVAATVNARKTLATGVTSARDLFAFDHLGSYVRALIDDGVIPGPRLFIATDAIHPLTLPPIPDGEERDVVAEFRKQAARRVDAGADWLKIFATTGSADDLTGQQLFFYPELKAATDVAHAGGLRVAVHSYSPDAVDDALRAGVDSIEHPVGVSDAQFRRWAETDTVYVPTIDHNLYYAEHRAEYGYDDTTEANLKTFVDDNVDTLRRAHEAGVRVAMGSDAVMTMFGRNTRELEWFVEAGMTPGEAIRAATVNGAALLGQEERLGRIEAGYLADIVAVEGNPMDDIRALTRKVRWVMKGGEVVALQRAGDDDRAGE